MFAAIPGRPTHTDEVRSIRTTSDACPDKPGRQSATLTRTGNRPDLMEVHCHGCGRTWTTEATR